MSDILPGRRRLVGCLVVIVASLAGAPGALASFRVNAGIEKSTSAGYSAFDSTEFGSLNEATTIVVPKIKDCTKQNQAVLVNVGVQFQNMNFSGFNDAGTVIECFKGKAHYELFAGNKKPSLGARPGDKVVISEVVTPSTLTASVKDQTHTSVKSTFTFAGQFSIFEGGITVDPWTVGNNGLPPVPDFGTIKFSASKLNGQPFGAFNGLRRSDRYHKNTAEIKTTSFSANKESFKAIFKHH